MSYKLKILDCSGISESRTDREGIERFKQFSQQLGDAMREIGFVYFINYEMTPAVVENLFDKSRDFFNLPVEVKSKYKKTTPLQDYQGFTAAAEENAGKLKGAYSSSLLDSNENFDFWGIKALDGKRYPKEVPGFKDAVDDFRSPLIKLAKTVSHAFAVYLKMEDTNFFVRRHRAMLEDRNIKNHNFIRSNYYFPQKNFAEDEELLRLGEHCDMDTFTFLFQDEVGGLEAKTPNGNWIPVPPIKNSIVFNVGFMMEIWSGGHIPATPHRVRLLKNTMDPARQSLAFFLLPDDDVVCKPAVAEKPNWVAPFPYDANEIFFDYISRLIAQSREVY